MRTSLPCAAGSPRASLPVPGLLLGSLGLLTPVSLLQAPLFSLSKLLRGLLWGGGEGGLSGVWGAGAAFLRRAAARGARAALAPANLWGTWEGRPARSVGRKCGSCALEKGVLRSRTRRGAMGRLFSSESPSWQYPGMQLLSHTGPHSRGGGTRQAQTPNRSHWVRIHTSRVVLRASTATLPRGRCSFSSESQSHRSSLVSGNIIFE